MTRRRIPLSFGLVLCLVVALTSDVASAAARDARLSTAIPATITPEQPLTVRGTVTTAPKARVALQERTAGRWVTRASVALRRRAFVVQWRPAKAVKVRIAVLRGRRVLEATPAHHVALRLPPPPMPDLPPQPEPVKLLSLEGDTVDPAYCGRFTIDPVVLRPGESAEAVSSPAVEWISVSMGGRDYATVAVVNGTLVVTAAADATPTTAYPIVFAVTRAADGGEEQSCPWFPITIEP